MEHIAALGGLDGLVCNAGIGVGARGLGGIVADEWDATIARWACRLAETPGRALSLVKAWLLASPLLDLDPPFDPSPPGMPLGGTGGDQHHARHRRDPRPQ